MFLSLAEFRCLFAECRDIWYEHITTRVFFDIWERNIIWVIYVFCNACFVSYDEFYVATQIEMLFFSLLLYFQSIPPPILWISNLYVESIRHGFLRRGCSLVSQVNTFYVSVCHIFFCSITFINFPFEYAHAFTVLVLMGEFSYGKSMRDLMRKTSLKLLEELSWPFKY